MSFLLLPDRHDALRGLVAEANRLTGADMRLRAEGSSGEPSLSIMWRPNHNDPMTWDMRLSRYPLRSEGRRDVERVVAGVLDHGADVTATDKVRRAISTFIRPVGVMTRRDRVLESIGESPESPPAWSHIVHKVHLSMLDSVEADWRRLVRDSARDGPRTTNRDDTTGPRGAGPTVIVTRRGTVDAAIHSQDGVIRVSERTKAAIVLDRPVPRTVAAAAAGLAIGDVLRHPMLEACADVRIRRIEVSEHETVIHPVADYAWVDNAPPGVDRSWYGESPKPV